MWTRTLEFGWAETRPRLRLILAAGALLLPLVSAAPARSAPLQPLQGHRLALGIDRDGLYTLSAALLARHGVTWDGAPASWLAVVAAGHPVPRAVSTSGALDQSSTVTFYARAARSRYTRRAVYYLQIDATSAESVPQLAAVLNGAPSAAVTATYTETRRTVYDPMGVGDGWYFRQLTAAGGPARATIALALPGVRASAPATLDVDLRGVTALAGTGPQHHFVATINGRAAIDLSFDGTDERTAHAAIPAGVLRARTSIALTAPGDVRNQFNLDSIDIRSFRLRFAQAASGASGRLAVALASGQHIDVPGFHTGHVSVWRVTGGPASLSGITTVKHGKTYTVSFTAPTAGRYLLQEVRLARVPTSAAIEPLHPPRPALGAGLLVIGPASMTKPLAPLLAYHRRHGLSTAVVAPSRIYAAYGTGTVDPAAIRAYITDSAHHGTRYVLLAGGDTFDPHGYLRCTPKRCPANPRNASIVPAPYAQDEGFGQIPSDEWYVDSPSGPALAIGRMPAFDPAGVSRFVALTLRYLTSAPPPRAVLAADREDVQFGETSEVLAKLLPSRIAVTRADALKSGTPAARRTLLAGIGKGARLVNFVGHGSLEQWGQAPGLLLSTDVARLPAGAWPGLYLGWGCQTAYYIDPTDRALNAALITATHGAALAIGSSGIDTADTQAFLAERFVRALFHDAGVPTVGEALRLAEVQSLATYPGTAEPVHSYLLFGDPALPVAPLRATSRLR